jgi:hypothetical protein
MHSLRHPVRFISIFALVLSAVFLGNAGTAAAANPLLCFDGPSEGTIYGGDCTINPGGTSATLITTDGDADGSYAGVYYATSNLSGDLIGTVTGLSFTYTCTSATTCVTGGSPRISVPIDTNNDGDTESYAFIDANNCGQAGGTGGTVTQACPVFFDADPNDLVAGVLYPNWAAFVLANPTYRISDDDAVPFVIADQPFRGTVSNIQLGQGEDANVATAKDECKNGGWENLTRADDTTFKNQGDCIQYVNTGK